MYCISQESKIHARYRTDTLRMCTHGYAKGETKWKALSDTM